METPAKAGFGTLTEKEKQTLRLIVRGHDAKSIARRLDLSVHTINERLRDARRKMAVSSSREAARLLHEAEAQAGGGDPDWVVDRKIGGDDAPVPADQPATPISGAGWANRRPRIIIGGFVMIITLGLLALAAFTQGAASPPPPTRAPAVSIVSPADAAIVEAAQDWLALLDQGNWADTYRGTGTAFQRLNTLAVWSQVSEQARTPLGAMQSRTLLSHENLPAPPMGYEVVKFRTDFANKAGALETVTLEREGDAWRVVGIIIE